MEERGAFVQPERERVQESGGFEETRKVKMS